MVDLTEQILELIRRTSTDLPQDVENAIREAYNREIDGSAAKGALDTILQNIEISRQNSTPICQDTGTPIFYVTYPVGWSTRQLRAQIEQAVTQATEKSYLRPNSVETYMTETPAGMLATITSQPSTLKRARMKL